MKKKKYNKNKKKKKFLKIIKEYAAVITIGMTILAFITNCIINYYKKASKTWFDFQYLTVQIKTDDFIKEYQQSNYGGFYHELLLSPTFNNELNQLLYKNPEKAVDYFITYLIIEQKDSIEAEDVKITFKQYGEANDLSNKELDEFPINKKDGKNISNKIKYPFPKGERLKIPISICKNNNSYTMRQNNCYYLKLEPISIRYKNKYLMSKREVPIRGYIEQNVIIDGDVVTGKGGTA